MAVQAQQYPEENLCFPLPYSQDWTEMGGFINLSQQRDQGCIPNSQVSSSAPLPSMAFSHLIASQMEKQRADMDEFIALQNESLRMTIQEQRKQQLAVLIKTLEARTLFLLKPKEEEIAEVSRKTAELDFCLKRMEMENQTWQRIAREKEAMVLSLNTQIEEITRQKVCSSNSAAQDAESCCEIYNVFPEHPYEERDGEKMVCKACNSQNSCVLILPCRHLCSCKDCVALLNSCPVCKSVKKASIEVYLS